MQLAVVAKWHIIFYSLIAFNFLCPNYSAPSLAPVQQSRGLMALTGLPKKRNSRNPRNPVTVLRSSVLR